MKRLLLLAVALCCSLVCGLVRAGDIDAAPIYYSDAPTDNVITRLEKDIADGKIKLAHDKKLGYLRAMLQALDVPESSQVLVFSKTSLQRHRIAPQTPRAIYFNDDIYLGYCRHGDVMEVSAVDANLGAVFYTLDQKSPTKPRFTRQGDSCLICHASSQNQGLPGHMVRSVFPDSEGHPILASGSYRIDQTSPMGQRWGGWYVTGHSGKQTHLGNLILAQRKEPEQIDNTAGTNVTDLSKFFETSLYPTPYSDIVALMVMEHQAQMHNLITRANFLTRAALYEEAELNKALGRGANYRSDSTISRIKNASEPLVRYLFFSEEAKLTEPLQGPTSFAKDFAARGPRDAKGRSLRDFDLTTRMFKYPCSYLVYSKAFDALPAQAKEYISQRITEVVGGKDKSKEFAHLSPADRKAITEILRETKPGLLR